MNLPKNGRIVIVDDNPNEALPLLKELSRMGHPASFFSGNKMEYPDEPIPGIRILFLDMVLIEGLGTDPRIVLGPLKSVLGRILSPDNGPILPIAWSDNPGYVGELEKYLDSREFPFKVIPLEKSECKSKNGEFKLDLIKENLTEAIRGNESLGFFTCWENIAHHSTVQTTNQISGLKPFQQDWNDKMKSIILKLAKSYVGAELKQDDRREVMENALFSLNGAFTDNLHTAIRNDRDMEQIELDFGSMPEDNDSKTNGIINSKINLDQDAPRVTSGKPIPGNVYELHCAQKTCVDDLLSPKNTSTKETTQDAAWKETNGSKNNIKYIVLEVTPACDYAQRKSKVSRLIPGFLWPVHLMRCKNAEYLYRTPVMTLNGDDGLYRFVFDFRLFTSAPFDEIEPSKYLFRIKQELLADIQSRLASHVSRLGTVSLGGSK